MTPARPVTGATHYHGPSAAAAGRTRLLIVFGLVVGFLVVELIGSVLTNSLALLADAGHMLTDAVGVGLALLAIHVGSRPATPAKSFGYYRLEILAAAVNAVLLFGVAAFVLYQAVQRLGEPAEVVGGPMLAIAVLGLAVNLVSIRLLATGARTS
jgi:cobalt-zinc-cadmium efflux system protein